MVYQKNFVAVVKVNGQVLREKDDNIVTLPFGCEYSIYLKNLHSRKCSVKIWIDDIDILFGKSLIIDPNSSIELERFIKDNNKGNRFKFIQKTKDIVEFRGDKPEDGIIRIEYTFEKEKPSYQFYTPWVMGPFSNWCPKCFSAPCRCIHYFTNPVYGMNNTMNTVIGSGDSPDRAQLCSSSFSANFSNSTPTVSHDVRSIIQEDEGITVPGSISNQEVRSGYIGQLEENSEVIIIRLKGYRDGVSVFVEKSITVKDKLECVSCGFKNDSSSNYCKKCGTNLNVI